MNGTIRDVRHVKAARELLRWTQERLAEMADLSLVSVRRYEAAKDPIAESIERDVVDALERAGVVFVAEGEVVDVTASSGVLLRTTANPDEPAPKKLYFYGAGSSRGRPAGKTEASARKPRALRKRPTGD